MFRCKFCHEYKEDNQVATAHKGLCKQCHSDITKYRRIMSGGKMDTAFVTRFELRCRHNESIGGYVPKVYYQVISGTVDRCPCCGMFNAKVYPSNPSMCYDCGVMENTYRHLLYRIKNDHVGYATHASRVKKIMDIERIYNIRYKAGLRVPGVYLRNREHDGYTRHVHNNKEPEYIFLTSEAGRVYKLRKGSTCKKCGVELNELNWPLGKGRICKECFKESRK